MTATVRGWRSMVSSFSSPPLAASASVASLAVLLTLAWAAPVDAQYRMLVNHGLGWSEAGDFRTLEECNREAPVYAAKHSAQAGCLSMSALERWKAEQQRQLSEAQAEAQFQQTAAQCAKRTRVKIILKPGAQVEYLGTTEARFAFDKCMAENGQPMESVR